MTTRYAAAEAPGGAGASDRDSPEQRDPRNGRYVLDPTGERQVTQRPRLDRGASISGLRVGLLDISKPRGDVFLDRLESRLTDAGARVQRFRKPTFTKPAPIDLRHEIATQCDVVIEALAD